MQTVSLIVAMAFDGAIGNHLDLPWGRKLPGDMARFKAHTMQAGNVLMGRATALSLRKPLPGRRNFVLTTRPFEPLPKGFETVTDLFACLKRIEQLGGKQDLAVIGGAKVYRSLAAYCHTALITHVHAQFQDVDTWLNPSIFQGWRLQHRIPLKADDQNAYPMTFETLTNPDCRLWSSI